MHIVKCDRCGKQIQVPEKLSLIRRGNGSTLPRVYEFDLCEQCSTKLFGWIASASQEPHKTGALKVPVRAGTI